MIIAAKNEAFLKLTATHPHLSSYFGCFVLIIMSIIINKHAHTETDLIICVSSKDSDQPRHPSTMITVYLVKTRISLSVQTSTLMTVYPV